jgi:CysZ protein
VGAVALKVVGTVLAVLASGLLGLALAQPLSGPALERIAREQERALGAPERPPTHFMLDVARSLKSMLLGYACGLPALAILALVSLLLPFAAVVSVPLKLVVTAFIISWDLCDYPLSIRGLRVRRRLDLIFSYKGAVLGFGVGLAACALVPCLLFLFLPAGVAAAARLMWEVEQYEHAMGRNLDGSPLSALGLSALGPSALGPSALGPFGA